MIIALFEKIKSVPNGRRHLRVKSIGNAHKQQTNDIDQKGPNFS